MTSANLLIVILVGAVVGALVGLALGGALTGFYLAVVAGFLATVIAGVARNEIMKRAGAGPDDSKIPNLVLIYSAVASLGGSSLADEVVRISRTRFSGLARHARRPLLLHSARDAADHLLHEPGDGAALENVEKSKAYLERLLRLIPPKVTYEVTNEDNTPVHILPARAPSDYHSAAGRRLLASQRTRAHRDAPCGLRAVFPSFSMDAGEPPNCLGGDYLATFAGHYSGQSAPCSVATPQTLSPRQIHEGPRQTRAPLAGFSSPLKDFFSSCGAGRSAL